MSRHETHRRRAAHRKLGGRLRRFFDERRPDRLPFLIEQLHPRAREEGPKRAIRAIPDNDPLDRMEALEVELPPGIFGTLRERRRLAFRKIAGRFPIDGEFRGSGVPRATLGGGTHEGQILATAKHFHLGERQHFIFSGQFDPQITADHLALRRRGHGSKYPRDDKFPGPVTRAVAGRPLVGERFQAQGRQPARCAHRLRHRVDVGLALARHANGAVVTARHGGARFRSELGPCERLPGERGLEARLPRRLCCEQVRRAYAQGRLECRDLRLQGLPLVLLLGREEREHRRLIFAILVRRGVQDREESEIILLRERVVFVGVALRTRHSRPHKHRHRRVHAVDHGYIAKLFVHRASLAVRRRVAVKRCRDPLLIGWLGQQVARQLLDREAIKRLVRVKGTYQIIPIRPDRTLRIIRVTRRIRIARLIQPQPRPVLAEGGLRQQAIDHPLIRTGRTIGDEARDLLRARRQPGHVEGHAARERRSVRRG